MIQDPGGIDTLYFVDFAPGITVNLALSGMDQIIDTSGTEIHLAGIFEALRGTAFDDSITVSPLLDTARFIDGNDGVDVPLIALGLSSDMQFSEKLLQTLDPKFGKDDSELSIKLHDFIKIFKPDKQ